MLNPALPKFMNVKKLENKGSRNSISFDDVKKPNPVEELLESPTWNHRREEV